MTLKRRSAWDVSADPTNSFDIHDDMHSLTATSPPADDLPPWLRDLIERTAAVAERERAAMYARELIRERRCG